MTGHTSDTNLNLGCYSIRKSSDLRVGSFWRRRQSIETNDEELIYSIPKKQQLTTTSGAISNRKVCYSRNSLSSRSARSDNNSVKMVGQLVINESSATHTESMNSDQSGPIDLTVNDTSKTQSCEGLERSPSKERSSLNRSQPLIIDTQLSCHPTKVDLGTHESFVVEIDPAGMQSFDDETTIESIRSSEELSNYSLRTPDEPRVQMRPKIYPKQIPYNNILSGVIFVMSGYVNPRRALLRDMAVEMGAKYQAKWNRFCTHLICLFKNTAKYKEVSAENGRIVREHWIQECSRQRQLLDWRNYKLGKYPCPDSEEEVDDLD